MTLTRYLEDGEEPYDGPIAILRTFVFHSRTKVLSGLAELSYVAGRAGDDEWDWAMEADDALIDAFFYKPLAANSLHPRSERLHTAKRLLTAAFRGGQAQREIDLAVAGEGRADIYRVAQPESVNVPEEPLALARAHATIYVQEIEFPDERHPENIRREIGYVATKVAQRHEVTAAEAAHCALKAFEERGLVASLEAAAWTLDRAAAGCAEREALEADARELAAELASATANLFGGEA